MATETRSVEADAPAALRDEAAIGKDGVVGQQRGFEAICRAIKTSFKNSRGSTLYPMCSMGMEYLYTFDLTLWDPTGKVSFQCFFGDCHSHKFGGCLYNYRVENSSYNSCKSAK